VAGFRFGRGGARSAFHFTACFARGTPAAKPPEPGVRPGGTVRADLLAEDNAVNRRLGALPLEKKGTR